ncbi:UDP-2,3-diacylglucosamine diphosphatase LpxI [bacterium]|nr:UDP-2,3-diacylglucosamine diphosphatase LpxI [bacterium]
MKRQDKKIGLFVSNDNLSEYVHKAISKYNNVFPFAFEDTPLINSKVFQFGDIFGIISTLKQENIEHLAVIGRISPSKLFENNIHLSGKQFLEKETLWKGEELMASAVSGIEKEGIKIIPLSQLLKELIAENSVYTKNSPEKEEILDIKTGISLLQNILQFRTGQAVAVKRGMIIAVEGVEGTDSMITRAGTFCKGFTVVKIAGKNKDERFDLPVIGPGTVNAIATAGGKILAVEAGKTILFEKEETINICEKEKITLLGVEI